MGVQSFRVKLNQAASYSAKQHLVSTAIVEEEVVVLSKEAVHFSAVV